LTTKPAAIEPRVCGAAKHRRRLSLAPWVSKGLEASLGAGATSFLHLHATADLLVLLDEYTLPVERSPRPGGHVELDDGGFSHEADRTSEMPAGPSPAGLPPYYCGVS